LIAIEEYSDIGAFDNAQPVVVSEFSHARIVLIEGEKGTPFPPIYAK
jgi:hypothetical protein